MKEEREEERRRRGEERYKRKGTREENLKIVSRREFGV